MTSVRVFKYDLTNGMAAQLAPAFLGINLEAIWHTSVVAFGKEFYFDGGVGVDVVSPPGTTRFGRPLRVDDVGATNKTEQEFQSWLQSTARAQFGPTDYHLLEKNCNHFSSCAIRFLFDNNKDISHDVLTMIPRLLSTPLGQMLSPMLTQFTTRSAGQSEQQQFQSLQHQFLEQQHQEHHHPHERNSASEASSSSSTFASVNEESWNQLVRAIESRDASESLNSLLWIDNVLNGVVLQSNHNSRHEVYPSQNGTNMLELDEKLLACLGFTRVNNNNSSSSWTFQGDDETLETAKMLASSLLSDLESRWSQETQNQQS